jgi:RNA polymerase sigma-70 factor, ECF subfamily
MSDTLSTPAPAEPPTPPPGDVAGNTAEVRGAERVSAAVDPATVERWVDEHGDYLFKFALSRVRNRAMAEDLVQDTFIAALRAWERFKGGSSERSWLCGILKNKTLDHFRKLGRETSFTDLEFLSDECAEKFGPRGFWHHELGPKDWRPEVDEVRHRDEFWHTLHECLSHLPVNPARVFVLREVEGVPSKSICQTLGISESNLWVMLHRGRMALRECLEEHWFGPAAEARKE